MGLVPYQPKVHKLAACPVISIVDDDEHVRASVGSLLRSYGYATQLFDDPEHFIASGLARTTDCLVSDIQMPGISGMLMYERLCALGIHLPVIFITASIDLETRLAAERLGASGYLLKPFDGRALVACIESVLSQSTPR